MLLSHVGRSTPLVVAFTGMCLGISAFLREPVSMGLSVLFLILLLSRNSLIPMFVGMALGLSAMYMAPGGVDITEGDYLVQGRVKESGFMRGTYRIVLDSVTVSGKAIPGLALLRVYDNVRELSQGVVIKGKVRVKTYRQAREVGEFDYRSYLLTQGIVLSANIKDFMTMEVGGQSSEKGIRDRLTSAIAAYGRPEAEILNASIIGDRSGLVYSLQDSFSSLGISHLIAISGLNMGVVFLLGYAVAFMILRHIPPLAIRFDTPLLAKIAGLVCVVAYTFFVGYSAPTARSAIMVCSFVGSLILLRRAALLESLSLAGIAILVVMPHSLYSASFLLSFSAVLGLIGIYRRMEGRPRWMLIFAVPLVSMAFTTPIVLYFFGFVSPLSIPANIVFVPWFSFIVMPLGMAGLAFIPLSDHISSVLLTLAFDGIGLMLKAAAAFGSLEPVPCPGVSWIIICYVGLVVALFAKPSRIKTAIIVVCCLLIITIPARNYLTKSREAICFDFMNVGQGDGVLVTKGTHAVLIDAGSSFSGSDVGRFIVGPHLLRRGVRRLDLVVITHSHPDHISGIPFVMSHFPVGEVWTNVRTDWSPDFQSVIGKAAASSISMKNVSLGDACRIGDIGIKVLNPPKRIEERTEELDLNLNSVVMKIFNTELTGLFMADAGGLGEIRLCRLDEDISTDVLKVAHHGSKQSCLNMFLEKVKPHIAVISVGAHNVYRLPHKSTLERLNENGVRVRRTDLTGSVIIAAGK